LFLIHFYFHSEADFINELVDIIHHSVETKPLSTWLKNSETALSTWIGKLEASSNKRRHEEIDVDSNASSPPKEKGKARKSTNIVFQ
jgi:hypothetical protein